MNLGGADLVMLSACETGLGQTAGGEGLLGLQRAFQSAGARAVVASLWSVPDEETRALMEAFYTNLWQRKLSPLESLRRAQLDMLSRPIGPGQQRGYQRLDAATSTPSGKRSPYSWAAFVLSGDWR
jgi:CHAT domain-containing protein